MTNAERLRRLRLFHYMLNNFNSIFPKAVFDMGNWRLKMPDGVHLCAGGAACSYGPFKKLGLKLSNNNKHGYSLTRLVPVYKDARYGPALAVFFGITGPEAGKIFWPHTYDYGSYEAHELPRSRVLRRITALMKKYEKKTPNRKAPKK